MTKMLYNSCIMKYGKLKRDGYLPRVVDSKVDELLTRFGAVEVQGPKYCGKTWTSLAFGESLTRLSNYDTKDLVSSDPRIALIGDKPVVIDEWQEVPRIWDCVRDEIDYESNAPGQFILTGSSTPNKEQVFHSGAGRIATLKMSTMTQFELGEAPGGVSLSSLFDNDFENVRGKKFGLDFYANRIIIGGWPSQIGRTSNETKNIAAEYLDSVFDVSVPSKGGKSKEARCVASSLARNLGSSAKLQTIGADIASVADKRDAAKLARKYLDIFESLYFINSLSGWDAPVRSKSRVRTAPKRYFSDVSLAASLLNFNETRILSEGQIFGLLFETLVVHDISVFASALKNASSSPASNMPICYYRDADGLEVDVIIELTDGRWAAIEIKLGEDKVADGISSLNRLRNKVALNPAARNPAPSFMAVVTGVGEFARYDKENDVYVIPFPCLEP